MNKVLIGLLLGAVAATTAEGGVFKCSTAKGVVYQGTPCAEGDQSKPSLVVNRGVDFKTDAYVTRKKIERLDDELKQLDKDWERRLRKLWGNDTYNLQRALEEKARLNASRQSK